jgi:uncharacterized protein YciI
MRQKFIEMRKDPNKKLPNGKGSFDEGRRLEQAGRLEDAAAAYQQVVDADPGNRDAVGRLLVVYRKLKEYRKELAVVEAALSAVAERDKTAQREWIRSHPGAAKIGMSVLRKLGGENASAFGTDPEVGKWVKRKAFLEKRIGGKGTRPGGGRRKTKKKAATATPAVVRDRETDKKKAAQKKRQEAAAAARKAAEDKKRAAIEKKRREAAGKKKQEAAQRKTAREAARAQAQKEKEAKAQPSLFIVSLRYLVALERIDSAMEKHVAFLDKHFKAGNFLLSGRQEPRTGGIIIAKAKSRAAVERIMRQDPFVRGKLASADIVEFKASKMSKELERAVRRGN